MNPGYEASPPWNVGTANAKVSTDVLQALIGFFSTHPLDLSELARFDLDLAVDQAALENLFRVDPPRFVHDTLLEQLGELMQLRQPVRKLKPTEISKRIQEHLAGRDSLRYGYWIYFPWSSRLVHVLPPEEYREVRTARNRYKIAQAEQEQLGQARVGVVGLSVGSMAAITFALEGIGGSFRVADYDHLSLSNLNRLRSGIPDLCSNKTVLTIREMYEIDPYLKIQGFPQGITEENIDDFLLEGGKLDLLVEECDDLYLKIAIRERCRVLGIPVVMETSDRGLLDIERFDLEPNRPVLHGLIGDTRAETLRDLPTKDKVPIVLELVGGYSMSTRMAASLPEIEQSITTWPQLASDVTLGGAIAAGAARRILLGEHTESGRYYVDVEAIVRDGAGMYTHNTLNGVPSLSEEIAPEAKQSRVIPERPAFVGVATDEAVRWMVAHAILSPSGHNSQPWKFVWHGGVLECRHDPSRDQPSLDFEHAATWLTFGAVAETIELAARSIGLQPILRTFPSPEDPTLVCAVRFRPCAPETSPLLSWVPRRVTNRKREDRHPLKEKAATALAKVAVGAECTLQLLRDDTSLAEIGAIIGAGDRISMMNRSSHHDTIEGCRWTREEVERSCDGLDMATLELTLAERAGFKLLSAWPTIETLRRLGGGSTLEDLAKKLVDSSACVGLLTTRGTSPKDYFRGGRAVQRVWLTAASHGLAFQPITVLPYLFARVERGKGEGLEEWQVGELRSLRTYYLRLFHVRDSDAELFLFRLGYAEPPTAISLRRPLDEVFTIA